MIPVQAANEPVDFDRKVRSRGQRVLEAAGVGVGRQRGHTPPGPSWTGKDYWREALDDMRTAYASRCAYLAMKIPHGCLATIDHFLPKSERPDLAYEWSNFRLATPLVNSNKGVNQVIDPFTIENGWFELEFVGMQVLVGRAAPAARRNELRASIVYLKLNSRPFVKWREEWFDNYMEGRVTMEFLQEHAPFVAAELERQGKRPAVSSGANAARPTRTGRKRLPKSPS